jgi:hypothetical protein
MVTGERAIAGWRGKRIGLWLSKSSELVQAGVEVVDLALQGLDVLAHALEFSSGVRVSCNLQFQYAIELGVG